MKQIELKKNISRLLVVISLILTFAPILVGATETAEQHITEPVMVKSVSDSDLLENDELFAYYVDAKLYGREMSTFGTKAREGLNTVEQGIYDTLKAKIEAVAANGGSTVFAPTGVDGLKISWTNTDLGVSSIEDTASVHTAFQAQFSLNNIVNALLNDCPFDLYWHDKTKMGGTAMSYQLSLSGYRDGTQTIWNRATVQNLTFTFTVVSGYQGENACTVTSDVSRIEAAKAEAQRIVEANQYKSDYEKLVTYREYICEAVSYNKEAVQDDYSGGYGDPWQLIYVFDSDHTTNVVCEGYSKAFQYLCDLSGLDCICAEGIMVGSTGAGGHMWNVVTLDDENYLVDVTNCDEGTVGAPNELFMVGGTYINNGYSYMIGNQTVTYTCEDLSLSSVAYEPENTHTIKGDVNNDGRITSSDIARMNAHIQEQISLTTAELFAADVNGDSQVDEADMQHLSNAILSKGASSSFTSKVT